MTDASSADGAGGLADVRQEQRERLWELLPAWMRVQDADRGVLAAVVDVLADASGVVADDLDGLADDWFIETCAEWIVPYIGDLVGVRGLHPLDGSAGLSNRARVADAIRFRRRKGTAAALEDLARVTTGWPARVVEYFEVMATTQHLDHVRLDAPAFADVRDGEAMERVDTPFEDVCRTVDVRPLGRVTERGIGSGHNLVNIGVHLWPLASYPVDRVTAAPVADPPDGRWFVDPSGRDRHLVGPTLADTGIADRTTEATTPGPLRRRPLHDELDAQRSGTPGATALQWFQPDDPSLVVWIQGDEHSDLTRVPLDLLHVCDLSAWDRPTGSAVRVDPVSGRVTVAEGRVVHRMAVSWSFGRAGRIGAGPWPRDRFGRSRSETRGRTLDDVQMMVGVAADGPGGLKTTLGDAVAAWHDFQAANPGSSGRIVIADSHRYVESFTAGGRIEVGQGARLEIIAAAWPQPADGPRLPSGIDRSTVMPTVVGDIEIVGTGAGETPGRVLLEGVVLSGGLTVLTPDAADDGLGRLELRSCTTMPPPAASDIGPLSVQDGNARAELVVDRCLVGPIDAAGSLAITITDSVVHSAGAAIDAPDADLDVAGLTALGTTRAKRLTADDAIFDDTVQIARRQEGCLRYSYVPPGSSTPRRFSCQPDLGPAPASHQVPQYLSLDPVAPGYAQLAPGCAVELRTGAEGGAEMGAFRTTLTPKRSANLAAALLEFLPFGRVAEPLPVLPSEGDQP